MNKSELSKDPYINLAMAIIEQAIDDYVWGLINCKSTNVQTSNKANYFVHHIPRFFKSDYFKNLTDIVDIDESIVLRMIEKKYNMKVTKLKKVGDDNVV